MQSWVSMPWKLEMCLFLASTPRFKANSTTTTTTFDLSTVIYNHGSLRKVKTKNLMSLASRFPSSASHAKKASDGFSIRRTLSKPDRKP